ncbi:MAG: Pseudouridine synthase [Candidatus Uhrbacteria bacterium GW2011_GWA2_52_8d]|uniref:Pseudouridine synthase n=1 Tax=Candidatus Uhrbacteria bacterium GW2011_GWA2_52_8d TaxID=1618979 RepID=A0A0G2AJT3_9BACT|nr:MAG: Pseudouridine synthase [Candidatus Uhrbacteria bacterium GW2011_GWA2_52_8d]
MPTIKIQASQASERLDRFLAGTMKASRSQIQRLIRQDAITINNKPAKSGEILEQGDIVYYPEIELSIPVKEGATPVLDLVYEDDDLLVINKPAGLLVHEALKDERRVTVVDGLLERYAEIAHVGDDPIRPGIVHRLDKDVSGLMVIAKTQAAFDSLKNQFQNRTIHKEYLALVYGTLPKETDTITLKIDRSKNKGRMVARTGSQEGKEAITVYDVLKRFSTATYVNVKILTGRTHQIRVHFQALGYPIVGDKLYKVKRMKFREIPLPRLFLHSHKLSIRLMDGKEKSFAVPLPEELTTLLNTLPTL